MNPSSRRNSALVRSCCAAAVSLKILRSNSALPGATISAGSHEDAREVSRVASRDQISQGSIRDETLKDGHALQAGLDRLDPRRILADCECPRHCGDIRIHRHRRYMYAD